ncbi:hypothetical protein BE221DRAFT_191547 [Ostreococcus tauri]|uniref:Uncharacterized protein n=1 Tax=Ostreococcus tauri TaxID=70448 RepID=A0A1Y5IJ76_OSTTA|nr:hypothetical protein BE221DRAFT_191547 [Ostreococcus tauri]
MSLARRARAVGFVLGVAVAAVAPLALRRDLARARRGVIDDRDAAREDGREADDREGARAGWMAMARRTATRDGRRQWNALVDAVAGSGVRALSERGL